MPKPDSPQQRTQTGSAFWRYSSLGLAALVFLADTRTPLGFAHGVLYTLPVMLAALSLHRRFLLLLGALCCLLILLAIPLAPLAEAMPVVLANRFVSLLAIASLTLLGSLAIKLLNRSQQAQQQTQLSLYQLEQREALLSMASTLGRLGGWILRLPAPGKMRQGSRLPELIWSPEIARIHGLTTDHAPNINEALAYFTQESSRRLRAAIRACVEAGTPYDLELQLRTADGKLIWVRAIGTPLLDEDGLAIEVHGAIQDLSFEKKQEQELEESNQRFQQLADAMPIIIWTALPNGDLDFANRALSEYTGMDSVELLPAQRWLNAVCPEDREYCIERWRHATETDSDYEAEFRLQSASREMRWHLVQAKPQRNADRQITRWYGTAIDINDRKHLERRTQELAERYQSTLESISDALIVLDHEWRFTYLNNQAEMLLQRNRNDLLGRVIWKAFRDTEDLREEYETAVQTQQRRDFKYYYKPLDLWLQIHAYPSSKGLTVYFYDVGQEMALQKALTENEERFRILARATTDSVWDWNARTGEMWWNDEFFSLFGFNRNEVVLSADFWASRIHPDDRKRVVKSIMAAIRGDALEWQEDYRFVRQDGSVASVSDRGYVIRDEKGEALRMVGGMKDITQRHNLEKQLQQTERLRAVGELTGGVAHDFNNLLTVIIGNAQVLSEILEEPQARNLAEMINKAASRSAQLTQRLMAFAQQQPLQPGTVNLKNLLDDLEPLLRRTLPEGIDFEMIHGGGLWPALVDPGQLETALLNLCLNARDAMPGTGRLTIETANTHLDIDYCEQHPGVEPGQYVLIAVSDTGSGIAQDIQNKIFDPFFTTKKKGRGAGLGLSMVYGFVKQSNGHIKLYSETGQGSTIKIYLPRSHEKQELTQGIPISPVQGGHERILLVEDDAMVRQLARGMLEKLGYQVVDSEDAAGALKALNEGEDFDLLFTDVILTGDMNGRQLAEAALALRPGLKVLYTSGYTENAIVHHGRLDPGIQLLSKPYRRRELAARIRRLLDA